MRVLTLRDFTPTYQYKGKNIMTNVLGDTSHLDPELLAAKERKLVDEGVRKNHGLGNDLDPSKRTEAEARLNINPTERNPERKLQHEYTGTHQITEQELKDREIIAANREAKLTILKAQERIDAVLKGSMSPAKVPAMVACAEALEALL